MSVVDRSIPTLSIIFVMLHKQRIPFGLAATAIGDGDGAIRLNYLFRFWRGGQFVFNLDVIDLTSPSFLERVNIAPGYEQPFIGAI